MRTVSIALCCGFVALSSSTAQTPRTIHVGDRVKIWAPTVQGDAFNAKILDLSPDVITVRIDHQIGEFYIQRPQVKIIDVSVKRLSNAKRVFAMGAVGGAFAGLVFGGTFTQTGDPGAARGTQSHRLRNIGLGAAGGTALASLFAFAWKTDVWAPATVDPGPP